MDWSGHDTEWKIATIVCGYFAAGAGLTWIRALLLLIFNPGCRSSDHFADLVVTDLPVTTYLISIPIKFCVWCCERRDRANSQPRRGPDDHELMEQGENTHSSPSKSDSGSSSLASHGLDQANKSSAAEETTEQVEHLVPSMPPPAYSSFDQTAHSYRNASTNTTHWGAVLGMAAF